MNTAESYYLEQTYGTTRRQPQDITLQYGKAVMIVVGSDGGVSEKEMAAWMAIATACGVSDDIRRQWREFDWKNARLEDYIAGISADPANPGELTLAFLYDAIRVSIADGYAESERKAVASAARALGIPQASVHALEKLVVAEESMRELRLSLLYPHLSRFQSGRGGGLMGDRATPGLR